MVKFVSIRFVFYKNFLRVIVLLRNLKTTESLQPRPVKVHNKKQSTAQIHKM